MKISNNLIIKKKNYIEKIYIDSERLRREKYFYNKFKNKTLNIPKIIKIKKNKIIFKKYNLREIKSQKKFFDELLKFLIKVNKTKNYKLYAKESLKSYSDLQKQIISRYKNFKKINFKKKFKKKVKKIDLFLHKIIRDKPKNKKLIISRKIISQSDIGFHNCAFHKKKVFFFDFEYSGLDNPIKMICDIYYQPEKIIKKKFMLKFIKDFQKKFNFELPSNFSFFEKLFRAKMMLIILNIFLKDDKKFQMKLPNHKLKELQLERLNKVYKLMEKPYLYE